MLARGEDALLLNADTVLPGAVERLARHCHVRPGIASVTPMSNTATILSFPSTTARNASPLGLDAAALDAAFAGNGAEPVEVPTGVGFCMHLNRAALDEVGPFSLDWGRGYCEEVEWCLTARDLGWVHLAATDTFVMHEGSVSFTPAARLALLAVNHARLEALYPDYVPELEAFTRADPLEPLREAVLLRLLAGRFARLTLHLTHGFGGGTERFIADLCALPRAPEHEVAVLRPIDTDGEDRRLELSLDRAGVSLTLREGRVESFLAGLEGQGAAVALHVHSRLFLTGGVLAGLLDGRRPYAVTLHDFQWYCPRVNLTDGRRFYCGEPPPQVCQICVEGDLDYDFGDQGGLIRSDMPGFLAFNERLLRGARALLAPSRDTAERYARRFGLTTIAVVPHPEAGPGPAPDRPRRHRAAGARSTSRSSAPSPSTRATRSCCGSASRRRASGRRSSSRWSATRSTRRASCASAMPRSPASTRRRICRRCSRKRIRTSCSCRASGPRPTPTCSRKSAPPATRPWPSTSARRPSGSARRAAAT